MPLRCRRHVGIADVPPIAALGSLSTAGFHCRWVLPAIRAVP
ncbi:hypothetical protein LC55x_4542 [Lysobacter capsici]|nr:hypothetical protein LC55x_4542 [Lysobacter capsici]